MHEMVEQLTGTLWGMELLGLLILVVLVAAAVALLHQLIGGRG